jgi:chitinase
MRRVLVSRTLAGLAAAAVVTAATTATQAAHSATPAGAPTAAASAYQKIAYFTQWGIYRRNFLVKNVDTSGQAANLTVINYAFANVSSNGLCFEANEAGQGDAWADYQKGFRASESVDGIGDTSTQPLRGNFNQLKELKAKHPHLKTLLSIGGWTWSKYFSVAAASEASRQAFVASCIDLFIKGNLPKLGTSTAGGPGVGFGVFDGIDLDWEWPGSEGAPGNVISPADKANYTLLAAEFRRQLDAYGAQVGRQYLLTAFLPADPAAADAGIEGTIFTHLDWATVQGYDLHGAWDPVTNHQSNVHVAASDPRTVKFSWDIAIDKYLSIGAPAAKLVPGVPFYGRGWKGVPNVNNGLFQPSTGPARGTYEAGIEDYKKIAGKRGTRFRDASVASLWLYDGNNFWTYDDVTSIGQKMAYIRASGLGGAMAWSLDGDDANASLTKAVAAGLP